MTHSLILGHSVAPHPSSHEVSSVVGHEDKRRCRDPICGGHDAQLLLKGCLHRPIVALLVEPGVHKHLPLRHSSQRKKTGRQAGAARARCKHRIANTCHCGTGAKGRRQAGRQVPHEHAVSTASQTLATVAQEPKEEHTEQVPCEHAISAASQLRHFHALSQRLPLPSDSSRPRGTTDAQALDLAVQRGTRPRRSAGPHCE